MLLKLKTAPTIEPVDLDELKNHLRIGNSLDDTLLASYLKAARQYVEDLCGPLITQTWYQYENEFPAGEHLPIGKPRLQSVTSLKYTDVDGTQATFTASYYTVATEDNWRPEIVLGEDYDWPSDDLFNSNPIEIEFICGYGDDTDAVPEPIRIAIMLLVSQWYEVREPVIIGQSVMSMPFAVECLLQNYRQWGF